MDRERARELSINHLLKRNLHLESIIFGAIKGDDEVIFESKIVFIVTSNVNNKIYGVFLDEIEAHGLAAMQADNGDICSVNSWAVQASVNEFVAPRSYPIGTKIAYAGGTGTIVGSDHDATQGIQRVLYSVLPEGLPEERDSIIFIFHQEIKEIKDDSEKE